MTNKQIKKLKPLYKMFSTKAHNYSTIVDKKLFLSTPKLFNDVFDGCVGFEYAEFEKKYLLKKYRDNSEYCDVISKAYLSKGALDTLIDYIEFRVENLEKRLDYLIGNSTEEYIPQIDREKLEKEIKRLYNSYLREVNKIRDSYYVACFTKTPPNQNASMWYFYTDNYQGFCCEFSLDRVRYDLYSDRVTADDYDYNICRRLHKVRYTTSPICINIDHLLTISPSEVYCDKEVNQSIFNAFCTKNISWRNEKEWRLIIKKEDIFFEKFESSAENNGVIISFPFLQRLSIVDIKDNNDNKKKVCDMAISLKVPISLYDVDIGQSRFVDIGKNLEGNLYLQLDKVIYSFSNQNMYSLIIEDTDD